MYKTLNIEKRDAVAIVFLNRPEKLNAYTVQMGEDLVAAFETLRTDEGVRCVVLTGSGRAFCAGVDLKQLQQQSGKDDDHLPRLGEEYFVKRFAEDLYHFPKPVISAINGAAIGVGVTMSMPCDIRLAAEEATLSIPFVKLGIVPGLGSSYMLPRLLGLGTAKWLALTGKTLSSSEALSLGLVDKVVTAERLLTEALELANDIARHSPRVVSLIKDTLNQGAAAGSIGEAIDYEHAANAKRS
jgi:enoyl-CoA hydratase/carnithine racemase